MNTRASASPTLTRSSVAQGVDAHPGRTKQEDAGQRAESLHGLHELHELHAKRH